MGGIIKRTKGSGDDLPPEILSAKTLACGCATNASPDISAPTKKWWCCGAYRKAKA